MAELKQEVDDVRVLDSRDAIRNSNMWAGIISPLMSNLYLYKSSTEFEYINMLHSPAMLQMLNEVLTNVVDAWRKYKKMKNVWLTYADETFGVRNDGTPIPVAKKMIGGVKNGYPRR